jgi:SAM-dependent methyltransferase
MTSSSTPYDELPYRSFPIEWTAPERLALASLLHGGPRQRLDEYRVLELGCGDGTNLIPMAYYRRHAEFVGIDSAHSQIAIANEKGSSLRLTNVSFAAADFQSATKTLSGAFDYIIGHGVFSWVSHDTRNALLKLCAERLRPGGLLYLNYNARPGWNVRGLIRDFLLTQTAKISALRARAERAREIAARLAAALDGSAHSYSQLLANEFKFVGQNPLSHTAHEYLAEYNEAYTRTAFLGLARQYGLAHVADADFSYASGRLPEGLSSQLARLDLDADTTDEVADFLLYRQLHSPILTQCGFERGQPEMEELAELSVASCLVEREAGDGDSAVVFAHPSGYEVEARSQSIAAALKKLRPLWPRGLPLTDVFADVGEVIDDVRLLHRNGMIELRVSDDAYADSDSEPLHSVERRWGDHVTTPRHTVEPAQRTRVIGVAADPIR